MDRRVVVRGIRRLSPFVVLVAVLALLAGGIPLLTSQPSVSSRSGLSLQAPGSRGSVHSLPWWDPRGWFGGGGGGAPSSTTLDAAALPRHQRMPHQAALGPVRRVKELTAKRTEYSRTYTLSDGKLQTVVSSGPVNYQASRGSGRRSARR